VRVAAGKLNKQIAGDLGLSEAMVKVHRAHAMQKMQAKSLADLVRMIDLFDTATAQDRNNPVTSLTPQPSEDFSGRVISSHADQIRVR
jgi:hypothetical protein